MSQALVERTARFLGRQSSRRGFLARSAVVGSAVVATPGQFLLRPNSAYAAVCNCSGQSCDCGSVCCDGYTEFCCTISGSNSCPPGTLLGGWWKVDGSSFCGGGARYYMDCNVGCGSCGCSGGLCSGSCSGTPCGCANGSCGNRKAGCTRFRYGQCHQEVACMGPILCRVVTCSPPWQLDPTCTTAVRTDNNTRNHHRPCLETPVNPIGALDAAVQTGSDVRVVGWAVDPETAAPIDVHIYANGGIVAVVNAGLNRPDIGAAYPFHGAAHGFDAFVRLPAGTHGVCAYAINTGAGINVLLGCASVTVSDSAMGSFDLAQDGVGVVRVAGWAADPNTTGPIGVHVYIDGTYHSGHTANRPRPDVAAASPGLGGAHGFEAVIPVTTGVHDVCVYALNVGPGDNALLGCRTVDVTPHPRGFLDAVTLAPGGLLARGWALDPDAGTGPVTVHLYVDGTFISQVTANTPRSDVGAAIPHMGANHGYSAVVPAGPGRRVVTAYALNAGPGNNALIGSRVIDVPATPFGSLDTAVAAGSGSLRVRGWALDPKTASPIDIHVYVDGALVGIHLADDPRPDVAEAYPALGGFHGFDQTRSVAPGTHQVCVYGISSGPGQNALLRCATVVVP